MNWRDANRYFFDLPIALSFVTFIWVQFRTTLKPYNSPLNLRISITEGVLKLVAPVALTASISELISGHINIHLAVLVCVGASTLRFHRNMAAIVLLLSMGYFIAIFSQHSEKLSHLELAVALGVLIPMLFKKFLDLLNISLIR